MLFHLKYFLLLTIFITHFFCLDEFKYLGEVAVLQCFYSFGFKRSAEQENKHIPTSQLVITFLFYRS